MEQPRHPSQPHSSPLYAYYVPASESSLHLNIPWKIIFLLGIWSLWINQNIVAFQNLQLNHYLHKECIMKAVEFHYVISPKAVSKPKFEIFVKWVKPPINWFKVYSDASILSSGLAGVRGLIRNSNGEWLKGFFRFIGRTYSLNVELWALRDGWYSYGLGLGNC